MSKGGLRSPDMSRRKRALGAGRPGDGWEGPGYQRWNGTKARLGADGRNPTSRQSGGDEVRGVCSIT